MTSGVYADYSAPKANSAGRIRNGLESFPHAIGARPRPPAKAPVSGTRLPPTGTTLNPGSLRASETERRNPSSCGRRFPPAVRPQTEPDSLGLFWPTRL